MNSRSAQSVQRSAYLIVGFVFVFGGLFFGYYVWSETKVEGHADPVENVQSTEFHPRPLAYPLTLALRVEDHNGIVVASSTLTNPNGVRLIVPDTVALEPLYGISVKYAPNKTAPLQELTRAGMTQRTVITDASPKVTFNRAIDAVIELLPGRSHAVSIPIGSWYTMKPGHYELRVNFRPGDIAPFNGTKDLPPFNASGAVATVAFDVPLNQPEKTDAVAPNVSERGDPAAPK
jgi:hypothetical protein